jgi:hypothetical protein
MEAVIAEPNLLTPPITIQTTTPFPERYAEGKAADSNDPLVFEERPSAGIKITAKVCSELMQYSRTVSKFDATEGLVLLTDSSNQPMVFSMGANKVSKDYLRYGMPLTFDP